MATGGSRDLCDICLSSHKQLVAEKWCPECEEKLCEGCHQHHSVSKATRNHSVIDIADYRKIPDSILEIQNFCDLHDMKYTNLCRQHDKLCCPVCTSGTGPHSECKTLLLQDVIKTANTSTLLKSMVDSLKSLTKNIETIIKDRKTNLGHLHEQRKHIEREVKETKETILKQLDIYERQILDDLNSKIKQNTKQLESEITDLEERLKKSENLLQSTATLVDFGSDLQTYIGSKIMEAEVAKETNSIQELVNSGCLKRFEVRLEKISEDESWNKISHLFGRVTDDVLSVTFTLTSELDKQAQITSQPLAVSIDTVKLSKKSEFSIANKSDNVRGCSVLPSGKILLANYSRKCINMLQENGEQEKEIPISSSHVYDVTVIDDNTMAVSCVEGVKIINISTGKTERTVPTGVCTGVEYYNWSLICGVYGKGVVSVDLSSNNITTIVHDTDYKEWLKCTVHRDTIYISRVGKDSITCYSMKGDKLWEYKDTSVISCPRGVAVDNSFNVYIVSYNNNGVVVLSPDGKRSRTLLTEEDGMNYPTALHFNRSNNQLVVVNNNGHGNLFSV